MDFSRTEAQSDLAGLTSRILDDQISQDRLRYLERGADHVDRACFQALADAGVLAAALPESAGGDGYGLLEHCAVLQEIGRHLAPVPYLSSILAGADVLARFGSRWQRERWARPAAAGTLLCAPALREEHSGDPAAPATTAEQAGDGFRLSGTKVVVPYGTVADLFLVPAATPSGPSVFLVAATDEGVHVERQRVTDGDSAAWLELRDVALASDRRLGGEHDGRTVVEALHVRFTVGSCAHQLGVTERALELTASYAREREQFDRPIGSFQAVAQRLADGYIDVEAIRLTTTEAAWRLSEGLDAGNEVATAAFWAADAGHRVAHTAVHVHGGVGIDLDHPVHRYFLAAKRNEFTLGGATQSLLAIQPVTQAGG